MLESVSTLLSALSLYMFREIEGLGLFVSGLSESVSVCVHSLVIGDTVVKSLMHNQIFMR